MKKLIFLMLIFAFQLVGAQAPDPDFNDKAAFSESRIFQKSAGFTESTDNASYDLIYQRLNRSIISKKYLNIRNQVKQK